MFKLTCFAPIPPEQLGSALKGLRFVTKKDGFEWYLDGHIFRIEPFKNQPRESMKGYRVFFNGEIDGGIYLFDSSLGWLEPMVTGVEFELTHHNRKTEDWIKELLNRPSYKLVDNRGLFHKGRVGVAVFNDKVTFQIRSSKGKGLKLIECLKEIELLQSELKPVEFDLFSCMEEGVAV